VKEKRDEGVGEGARTEEGKPVEEVVEQYLRNDERGRDEVLSAQQWQQHHKQ
jgi:hypothetical protein